MERFISRGDDPKSATYILMQPKYDEKNQRKPKDSDIFPFCFVRVFLIAFS